jgi:adenylate cyclase
VAALSAAVGLLLLTPLGGPLEEEYGLGSLFELRGLQPAPPNVMVVAIDRASAEQLGLPPPPWPRSYHARLVNSLAQRGAKAIVFDVIFAKDGSASEDDELSGAIRKAGTSPVVLLQRLERQTPAGQPLDITVDPVLRSTAVATAPFPLPVDSTRVTRFWAFRDGAPTLPAVALQLAASDISEDWAAILATEMGLTHREAKAWRNQSVTDSMIELRRQMKAMPAAEYRLRQAIQKLDADKAKRLAALLALYSGEDSRLVNFLGPAGTVSTLSFAAALAGDAAAQVAGKVVLVGSAEREIVSNIDSYETVYSGGSGINVSGVEILATAVTNLTQDTSIRTSGAGNMLAVVAAALVIGMAAASGSHLILRVAFLSLLLALPAVSYHLFVSANIFVPWLTPMLASLVIGFPAALWGMSTAERKLRGAIESAARQFLPKEIGDRLAYGPLSKGAAPVNKIRFGIFLATDIEGFTTVAERLSPEALNELVSEYFNPLFETILGRGGEVLDLTGDSMMCAWYVGDNPLQARANAIMATLDLADLVASFNLWHPPSALRTRFGLCAGTAAFGVVGGSGRYVATVVGDVTNTASRIDSLNKILRTCVLASEEVAANIDGVIIRRLGSFAPVGKSESVELVEILGRSSEDRRLTALARAFAAALAAFDAEQWSEAVQGFTVLHETHKDDGPTSYFLDLAAAYARNPPSQGTVRPIRVNIK